MSVNNPFNPLTRLYWLLPALALLLTTACGTTTERTATRQTTATSGGPHASQSTRPPSQRPAAGLRIKAAALIDSGDLSQAERLLERALRIDARDPATYYELARLRWLQQRPERAGQYIEKGLSLNPDQRLLQQFDRLRKRVAEQRETAPAPS